VNSTHSGPFSSTDSKKLVRQCAPDLGIPNRRFQNIAFRFKEKSFYEKKSRISSKTEPSTRGE
jgi:hypothetical protein